MKETRRGGRSAVQLTLALLLPLLLFAGCSATKSPADLPQRETRIQLDAILEHLPARDAAEQRWIGALLLDSAPESITRLCHALDTLAPGNDSRVRYALSGATAHATLPGHGSDRVKYAGALCAALGSMRTAAAMAFVIEQLQIAGGPESVETLGSVLADESMCGPAAMALVSIRTPETGARLLEAARSADGSRKATLVQALGEVKSQEAVVDLMAWAQGDDASLRQASTAALASIGDPRSIDLIKEPSLQLVYARRLGEQQHVSLSEQICRSILSSVAGSAEPHLRCAALRLLADMLGERALNDIVTAAQDANGEVRACALDIAAGMTGEGVTERWVSLVKQPDPGMRAGVVRMLGQRDDPSAVPAVYNALSDPDPSVRIAAVAAASHLGAANTVDSILVLLERTERPDEIAAVRDALRPLPLTQSVPAAVRVLQSAMPPARVMLLQFLSEGGSLVHPRDILPFTRDATAPVRLAAIKTLENVAGPDDTAELVRLLMEDRDEGEWSAIQRSIVTVTARNPDPGKRADALLAALDGAEGAARTRLIRTIGRVGGTKAVATLSRGIAGKDPAIKDASIRALAEAPGIEGFDPLLAVARGKYPLPTRALALRGCLRMVNEAGLPPVRSVPLLGKVLAASERHEEKRLALASLGKAGSREALHIISGYLRDEAVGLDAALAIRTMAAGGEEERPATLSRDDLVRVFIEKNASPKVLAQLKEYDVARSDKNVPPEGFVALFNGKNLAGWKGLVADPPARAKMTPAERAKAQAAADSLMRRQWTVDDGVLMFNGDGFANLCTAKDYANFELLVDWKIEKEGDSGIYLRGSPQAQIWDPVVGPEGSGGLYNNQKNPRTPLRKADKPAGQWNTFRIRMIGERVTVYLNNVLVTDNVVLENYWEREKSMYPTGQIELQAHNSPLYFRNIFIRELPAEREKFSGPLFNGMDLAGWEPVGGSTPWSVKDGVLFAEGGGGGWISTVKQFDNFMLDLEFRVPEGGNSGVFLRTPREGDPAYVGMEIQVLDDYAPVYANLRPWQYAGSVYGVQAPSARASKKAGEWQHMVIVADGPHVAVTLNGQRIVDTNLISHMELEQTHPGIKRRGGYIGLQNHSTRIEYRNVRLTEY